LGGLASRAFISLAVDIAEEIGETTATQRRVLETHGRHVCSGSGFSLDAGVGRSSSEFHSSVGYAFKISRRQSRRRHAWLLFKTANIRNTFFSKSVDGKSEGGARGRFSKRPTFGTRSFQNRWTTKPKVARAAAFQKGQHVAGPGRIRPLR
jgi:hypothetical protein